MAQAYKLVDQAGPRLDADKMLAFFLQLKLRGYSFNDPPPNPKVTVTASILSEFIKISTTKYGGHLANYL